MTERVVLEYLANAAWQAPLVALSGWMLLWAGGAGARWQHRVWLLVLAGAVVLPACGVADRATALPPASRVQPTGEPTAVPVVTDLPGVGDRSAPELQWGPRLAPSEIHLSVPVARGLMALYCATCVIGLLRLARSWRSAKRLARWSVTAVLSDEHWALLAEAGRRLGVALPRVRASAEVACPMILGVRSPLLLLPSRFDRYAGDEVEAMFFHELAHVQRRDCLVQILCEIATVPLVWHPVTFAIQRRIRRTREMVCDAVAARAMQSEVRYARCLVRLAEGWAGESRGAQALGLFDPWLNQDVLEERVMSLIEKRKKMACGVRMSRWVAGATAVMASLGLAAAFHVRPMLAQAAGQPRAGAGAASTSAAAISADPAPAASVRAIPLAEEPEAAPRPGTGKSAARAKPSAGEPANDAQAKPAVPTSLAENDKTQAQGEDAWSEASEPQAWVSAGSRKYVHRWTAEDGQRYVAATGDTEEPSLEERHRLEEKLKQEMDAMRLQTAAMKAQFSSPEFRKQMEDLTKLKIDRKQVNAEAMKQQAAAMKQMAAAMKAQFSSPEFRKQMEDLTKLKIDLKQMDIEAMKRQALVTATQTADLQARIRSGAIQQELEQAERMLQDAKQKLQQMQRK